MKAIMYHYVRPFSSEYPYFKNLHIEDFIRQLDYFEKEFGFVSLNDFLKSFVNKEVPKGVILTFDDGLSCHYNYVFPELMKRNLWGIFYIPTQPYTQGIILDVHRTHLLLGKIQSRELYYYLKCIVNSSMIDQEKLEEFDRQTYTTQQNDDYTLMVKRMLNYFISYKFRGNILNQLMSKFLLNENDTISNYYLTPSQIKEMHNSGMIIGSHTINHPVMSRLNNIEQSFQIEESFKFLENVIGGFHHKTFCYPYGGFHSFTNDTERLLKENDCLYSFNVEQRDIELKDLVNRPQALPRYDCNQFIYGQVRSPERA